MVENFAYLIDVTDKMTLHLRKLSAQNDVLCILKHGVKIENLGVRSAKPKYSVHL